MAPLALLLALAAAGPPPPEATALLRGLRWGVSPGEARAALARSGCPGAELTFAGETGAGARRFAVIGCDETWGAGVLFRRTLAFRDGALVATSLRVLPMGGAIAADATERLRRALTAVLGEPEGAGPAPAARGEVGDVVETVWRSGSTRASLVTSAALGPLAVELADRTFEARGTAVERLGFGP